MINEITFMQIRLVRLFCERLLLSVNEVNRLFKENSIYEMIDDCYDSYHMAIKDLAKEEEISEDEARNRIMSSKAVETFYDADNELWSEGPDALVALYKSEW